MSNLGSAGRAWNAGYRQLRGVPKGGNYQMVYVPRCLTGTYTAADTIHPCQIAVLRHWTRQAMSRVLRGRVVNFHSAGMKALPR